MTHVAPKNSGITEFTDEALRARSIGAQSGDHAGRYLRRAYPDADIRLYPTQDEVNLDLASGRLDLQVGDIFPLLDWVNNTEDGACCELIGEPITDPQVRRRGRRHRPAAGGQRAAREAQRGAGRNPRGRHLQGDQRQVLPD